MRFVRHLGTNMDRKTAERKAYKVTSAILKDIDGIGKKKKKGPLLREGE